ncbi:MAG: hypothetical protein CBC71_06035 [Rhodobacteraceae bacterium TMED111]|nr:MAG: hypothetical protein CBC71_06035 [Rhodobacteraceae bacterium TMED111]|tara:strand:- start:13 stop:549 length:537 start_codon:yes stop_codon:yes gene_type:complete
MSTLRVDSIRGQTEDGTYRYLVQMKHFQLTTTQTEAISSANTDQAISNFTVNITPTSANSIIKLEAQLLYESANEPWETMFFFFRDSTKLAHTESAGSRRVGIASPTVNYHSANNASTVEMVHMGYFDSPSSTSSIAYKLGINTNATNNLFINRTVDDTDSNGHERGVSWISAMEIAQ